MWLAILIYLIGYVVSYFVFRWRWVRGELKTEYTIGIRRFNLFFSLLSWVAVLSSVMCYFEEREYPNKDKKANW